MFFLSLRGTIALHPVRASYSSVFFWRLCVIGPAEVLIAGITVRLMIKPQLGSM